MTETQLALVILFVSFVLLGFAVDLLYKIVGSKLWPFGVLWLGWTLGTTALIIWALPDGSVTW